MQQVRPKDHHIWRLFKEWVAKNKPKKEGVSLNKIKVKTVQGITSCEPRVIAKAFDEMESMAERLGLMKDGVLVHGERLLVTDEKGFSFAPFKTSPPIVILIFFVPCMDLVGAFS